MKLAFFEGDSLVGVGFTNEPHSYHYLCPTCGTIWGREIVLDPERSPSEHTHFVCHVHCPEHIHPWRSLPLFSTQYHPHWLVRTYPREVLVRDFLLLDMIDEQ